MSEKVIASITREDKGIVTCSDSLFIFWVSTERC
jgi:hypothetical protein